MIRRIRLPRARTRAIVKTVNHPHEVGESDDNSGPAAISCGADPRTVVATGVGAAGTTVFSATVEFEF